LEGKVRYDQPRFIVRTADMKTAFLFLLAVAAVLITSCSVRGHANRNSTGAGISTPGGSVGGAIRY
jgi:hypothetical protein